MLIPDHDAGVFNPPVTGQAGFTSVDNIIFFLVGGFRRWDAVYFLHIAQHGYTYENCVAFFPLYPLLVSAIKAISAACPFLSEASLLLLFGVLVNVALFVAATVLLLHLGQAVTQDGKLAFCAAVLFCINPASVFMTAPYTETLFAFLSFGGMLCIKQRNLVLGSLLIGLSALTRSNGLVSTGFVLHHLAKEHIQCLTAVYKVHYNRVKRFLSYVMYETTVIIFRAAFVLLIALTPFACFQFFLYELFCFPEDQSDAQKSLDESILKYGLQEKYKLVGEGPVSTWCLNTVPLSYSYIQSHHWGVGFMAYYQVKQIPNFILAAPVIILSMCACYSFCHHQSAVCRTLGLLREEKEKVETVGNTSEQNQSGFHNAGMVVFVLHLLFLTLFGAIFMHIQVIAFVKRIIMQKLPVECAVMYCRQLCRQSKV